MSTDPFMGSSFAASLNELRRNWGWFIFFGIALIALGALCVVSSIKATWVTVVIFGWVLLVAGVFALVQAFRVHTWSGFFLYFLSALFRGFIGYLLVRYPDMGAYALTMILASFFVVVGLFRATFATMLKFPNWGWVTFSGILAFILGVWLLAQLPVSSIWFIGFAIGVDLIFDGVSLLALASSIHKLPKLPGLRHA